MAKTKADIAAFLRERIASVLGIPPSRLDIAAPASSYGLSSVEAVVLAGEISTFINRELPANVLLDANSVDELAEQLALFTA